MMQEKQIFEKLVALIKIDNLIVLGFDLNQVNKNVLRSTKYCRYIKFKHPFHICGE